VVEISIPWGALEIIERLEAAGFEAFAVGGCVRDSALGKSPTDWDVTTNALPAQIAAVFCDAKKIEFGERHGTISVKSDSQYYEITTYRIDGVYSDGRRPDSVSFTPSLEDDLRRRDFTINAMAYSPKSGLVDPFSGHDDLKAGLVRAVGDANERFREDYLRIIRAYRFAATLGFELEPATRAACLAGRHNLEKIARERIGAEVSKLLAALDVEAVVRFLEDAADVIFPDLAALRGLRQNSTHHIYDAYEHTLYVIRNTPNTLHQRLAAIFHDTGKLAARTTDAQDKDHFHGHAAVSVEIAERALSNYCLDNRVKSKALGIIRHHMRLIEPEREALKHLMNKLGVNTLEDILQFQRADNLAKSAKAAPRLEAIERAQALLAEIIAAGEPVTIKDLAITGQDVMRTLGLAPSPAVGAHLNQLLEAVVKNPSLNTREGLIGYLLSK